MTPFIETINQHKEAVQAWLEEHEAGRELPLYSSVDIRDSGFKLAVVDSNLFPSGFNNLCPHGIEDSVEAFRQAILQRVSGCRNILILAEEHTRNTWYLEHLRILQTITERAGFATRVATFISVAPDLCREAMSVELETATGKTLKMFSLDCILREVEAGRRPCFIIMNNDLMTGIPETLRSVQIPIYPSLRAGWHSRLKSHHFAHTAELMRGFSEILGLDPWLFSCLDTVVESVGIHEEEDRVRLADAASDVFRRIQAKYDEHGISQKPFVFVKADRGTYGMGVMAMEDPQAIVALSRRNRNQLHKGKGGRVIDRYLIQEGIPTSYQVDDQMAELCVYQIANQFVGGFYRTHGQKSDRENLNSKGMTFKTLCPHVSRYRDCGLPATSMFAVYRTLARIAAIAAHREIEQLETVDGA